MQGPGLSQNFLSCHWGKEGSAMYIALAGSRWKKKAFVVKGCLQTFVK